MTYTTSEKKQTFDQAVELIHSLMDEATRRGAVTLVPRGRVMDEDLALILVAGRLGRAFEAHEVEIVLTSVNANKYVNGLGRVWYECFEYIEDLFGDLDYLVRKEDVGSSVITLLKQPSHD